MRQEIDRTTAKYFTEWEPEISSSNSHTKWTLKAFTFLSIYTKYFEKYIKDLRQIYLKDTFTVSEVAENRSSQMLNRKTFYFKVPLSITKATNLNECLALKSETFDRCPKNIKLTL